MYTYRIYNFAVCSDLEFPELLPDSGSPSAFIRLLPLTRQDVEVFHDGGDHIGSGVDDFIYFQVSEGREIRVSLCQDADLGEARAAILGGVMATLLRQRGMLVLHACAVARDGEAIAFLGDSGWGKSTLAEYFCQNGYRLINDDVVALDVTGGRVEVVPGYPQIKLRQEAGAWLRRDYAGLEPLSNKGDKRGTYWREGFDSTPLPLSRLYFLRPFAEKETAVAPIKIQDAIRELIMHTRVNHLITAPEYQTMHLQQCTRLLSLVPAARLHRKKSLDALSEILTEIEQSPATAR